MCAMRFLREWGHVAAMQVAEHKLHVHAVAHPNSPSSSLYYLICACARILPVADMMLKTTVVDSRLQNVRSSLKQQ